MWEALQAEITSLRIRRRVCGFLERTPLGCRVQLGDVASGVWVECVVDEGYPYRPPSSVRVYGWPHSEGPLVPWKFEGVPISAERFWRPGDDLERLLDTLVATVQIARKLNRRDLLQ